MRAVTIKEAKAHLNDLVDAATRGEQVVLLRGSVHVAAIIPITAEDMELKPRLSDAQAERIWHQIAEERKKGTLLEFDGSEEAVRYLGRPSAGRSRRRSARTGKPRPT